MRGGLVRAELAVLTSEGMFAMMGCKETNVYYQAVWATMRVMRGEDCSEQARRFVPDMLRYSRAS